MSKEYSSPFASIRGWTLRSIAPMFMVWAWLLARYRFSPGSVFLLFGINGVLAEFLIGGPACTHNGLPVRRWYASRYFAWVLATTSAGKAGAGGVLFQSSVSR